MRKLLTRTTIGASAIAATLLGAGASLGAAEPTPTCNGLEARIVVTEPAGRLIAGTEGDDVMVVHAANDEQVVAGLGGNDTICTFDVTEVVGGPGDDFIQVIDPVEQVEGQTLIIYLLGEEGDDVIHGADHTYLERIWGGPGNDVIYGHGGWDVINGDGGDDVIYGNAGDDYLVGGGGSDIIRGGWGIDTIFGGDDPQETAMYDPVVDGGDVLYGGPGGDWLFGQIGADALYGGDDDDVLLSNQPEDLDDVDGMTRSLFLDDAGARMFGGRGDDLLVGSNRWDRMFGGPGDDKLWGFEGRDYVRGGAGDDLIIGGPGIDDTHGNGGNDHIIHLGADITHGGYGLDRCESTGWPFPRETQSCEEVGAAALDYTPPSWYPRIQDSFVIFVQRAE